MNLLFTLLAGISLSFGSNYQVGDVLMQSDKFEGSAVAIKTLTLSKYNHVGIVVERGNKLYVAEALATVRYTPVDVYINRGKAYRHLRPKTELTAVEKNNINKAINKYRGKKYDPFLSWSDDRMYCSELVAKVYEDAGVNIVNVKRRILSHGLMMAALPILKSGLVNVPNLYKEGINDISVRDVSITPADINRSLKLKEVN